MFVRCLIEEEIELCSIKQLRNKQMVCQQMSRFRILNTETGSVLQCVVACCSALQCVAVCCSVLQCGLIY